jgi:hypothetical protein
VIVGPFFLLEDNVAPTEDRLGGGQNPIDQNPEWAMKIMCESLAGLNVSIPVFEHNIRGFRRPDSD